MPGYHLQVKLFALAALLVSLLVPAVASSSVRGASGLRGVVMRGPIQPVCSAEQPCDAPAPHVKLTFRHGGVSRTATTDAHGHYALALPAGSYSVVIAPGRFGYAPKTVAVPAGRVAVRNFSIDTGIR